MNNIQNSFTKSLISKLSIIVNSPFAQAFSKSLICFILFILIILPFAYSVNASPLNITDPTQSDINAFNQILAPVIKVYNFVKYSASVLALLFLVFAAISMFMNTDNPMEKDKAKSKIMYIVIGLIIIWIAPLAVNYLTM